MSVNDARHHYSSLSSYHKLLHEAGMSWKKTEKVNPKRDEEAVIKSLLKNSDESWNFVS